MQFDDALSALRACALAPDRESLVFAEGKVVILPESPARTAALAWLDMGIVNAESGLDPERVHDYARSALWELEQVRAIALQYKTAYQRYQAARREYETDPDDEKFDAIRATLSEAERLRKALVEAT